MFLKLNAGFSKLEFDGKWRQIENFHLTIEKISQEKHYHPKLIEGYGDSIF